MEGWAKHKRTTSYNTTDTFKKSYGNFLLGAY